LGRASRSHHRRPAWPRAQHSATGISGLVHAVAGTSDERRTEGNDARVRSLLLFRQLSARDEHSKLDQPLAAPRRCPWCAEVISPYVLITLVIVVCQSVLGVLTADRITTGRSRTVPCPTATARPNIRSGYAGAASCRGVLARATIR